MTKVGPVDKGVGVPLTTVGAEAEDAERNMPRESIYGKRARMVSFFVGPNHFCLIVMSICWVFVFFVRFLSLAGLRKDLYSRIRL